MNRLHLRLPPQAGVSADTPLAYAVIDAHGVPLQSGTVALRALRSSLNYAVQRIEATLDPNDYALHVLSVPPLRGQRLRRAVISSLDTLAGDDLEKLTIVHSVPDAQQRVVVAWTDRQALTRLLDQLQRFGCRPHALYPAVLTVPTAEPLNWHVRVDDSAPDQPRLWVRCHPLSGFCCAAAPAALEPPVEWQLMATDKVAHCQWEGVVPGWANEFAVLSSSQASSDWWRFATPVLDLLSQQPNPTDPAKTQRWRQLTGAALALYIVGAIGVIGHAQMLKAQDKRLRLAMQNDLRAAYPDLTVIVDPLAQLRQRVAANLTQPEAREGLALLAERLARTGQLMPGSVEAVTFREGRLRLTVPRTLDSAAMARAAAQAGLIFTVEAPATGSNVQWQIAQAESQ